MVESIHIEDFESPTEQFGCGDPRCLDCGRPSHEIKGILVMHLHVGQLSPEGVDRFVIKMRAKFADLFDRLREQGWENMIIPVRDRPTKIEAITLS